MSGPAGEAGLPLDALPLDPARGLDAPPPRLEDPAITRAAKLCLSVPSAREWAPLAVARLDETLLDHAWCEKKAAATGMAIITRYPDDPVLVRAMIELVEEEWLHFARVHEILEARGVRFAREQRDPYVNALVEFARSNEPERYLDRMLVAAFVEARSCERFALLAQALPEEETQLREFYTRLFIAEARHYTLFVRMAERRVDREQVRARLREMSVYESSVVRELPIAPRMH